MITILDLAVIRGVKSNEDGSITAEAFADVGLAIIGGCECCGATIAAYNGYPSKSGNWRCGDCIDTFGFDTVESFRQWARPTGGL